MSVRPLATAYQRAEAQRLLSDWRAADPAHRKIKRQPLSDADITPVTVLTVAARCEHCGRDYQAAKLTVLDAFLLPDDIATAIDVVRTVAAIPHGSCRETVH